MTFREDLIDILNIHGWDSKTNTPDTVLAEKIISDLESFKTVMSYVHPQEDINIAG